MDPLRRGFANDATPATSNASGKRGQKKPYRPTCLGVDDMNAAQNPTIESVNRAATASQETLCRGLSTGIRHTTTGTARTGTTILPK